MEVVRLELAQTVGGDFSLNLIVDLKKHGKKYVVPVINNDNPATK